MSRLTLDKVLCLVLAISRVDHTLHDVEVELALALSFACNHVLLVLFWVGVLAAVDVHVVLDRALVVVVQLTVALVRSCRLVVFPRGVVVSLVLPFDLRKRVNTAYLEPGL